MKDMTLNTVSIWLSRLEVYTRDMVVSLTSSIGFEGDHANDPHAVQTKDKNISQAGVRGCFLNNLPVG